MSLDIGYYFMSPDKFPLDGFLDGISRPDEILSKAKRILESVLVQPDVKINAGTMKSEDMRLYGNYSIGEGTIIYNGVTVIGPVYIGKNCELMPGAIIRPYSIIGDNCSVGHGSELKRAVLYAGAKVASLAFVGDSVLGAGARIGSGVITANRKFNQSEVKLKSGDTVYGTGDSYFGLILGDFARLGANCVTQPGTLIGPYTWLYPMTTVRGFIPRERRVYHPRELQMEDNEVIELKP